MMKRIIGVLIFSTLFLFATAQSSMLTMEDALVKNRSSLAPSNLKQLQFVYATDDYVYLKPVNGKDTWVRGNIKNGEQSFLTLKQLNEKLKAAGLDTLTSMPSIQFNKSAEWIFTAN